MDEQKTSSLNIIGEEKNTEKAGSEENAQTSRIRRPRPEGEKTSEEAKIDLISTTSRIRRTPAESDTARIRKNVSESEKEQAETVRMRRPRSDSERPAEEASETTRMRRPRPDSEKTAEEVSETTRMRRPRPDSEKTAEEASDTTRMRRPRPEGEEAVDENGRVRRPRPEGERRQRPEDENRGRTYINKEPQHQSGTMRDNLDKYRTDNVDVVKKRQANASASREQHNAALKRKKQEEMRKAKKKGVIVRIITAVIIALICVLGFLASYKIFYDVAYKPNSRDKMEITVTASSTDEEVGKKLEELGCIEDAGMYKLRAKVYDADYVEGTYKISPAYTTEKIVNILSGYDYSDGTMSEDG